MSCNCHLSRRQCPGAVAELYRHELRTLWNSKEVKRGHKKAQGAQNHLRFCAFLCLLWLIMEQARWPRHTLYRYLKSNASFLRLRSSRSMLIFTALRSTIRFPSGPQKIPKVIGAISLQNFIGSNLGRKCSNGTRHSRNGSSAERPIWLSTVLIGI